MSATVETYPGNSLLTERFQNDQSLLGYVPLAGVQGMAQCIVYNLSQGIPKQITVPTTHPFSGQFIQLTSWFHTGNSGNDHLIRFGTIEMPLLNNWGYMEGRFFFPLDSGIEVERTSNGNTQALYLFGIPVAKMADDIVIN